MAYRRKTPYFWSVEWPSRANGYVPSVTVAAWSHRGAIAEAKRLFPSDPEPSRATCLDKHGPQTK